MYEVCRLSTDINEGWDHNCPNPDPPFSNIRISDRITNTKLNKASGTDLSNIYELVDLKRTGFG